jgi:hypothetical protein
MANARISDVMASVEKWLIDNWPDDSVTFVPSSSDGPRPNSFNQLPDVWAQPQWISFEPEQPVRPGEDWVTFDLRLICQARVNDRLRVANVADGLRDLIRSAVVEVVDRADGSTSRGWVRFNEVGVTPPQKDQRDVVVAVVDVVGWAHTS